MAVDEQLSRLRKPRRNGKNFSSPSWATPSPAVSGFGTVFNRPAYSEAACRDQRQSIDFSVQLGDMVSSGQPDQYERFFTQLGHIGVEKPYLTVIGNHDRSHPHGGSHSRMYRALFGRSNYHFDYGGIRFIILDSSSQRVTALQMKWLSMVGQTRLRKVVFTHMPPSQLRIWGGAAAHHMGGFQRGAAEFTDLMSRLEVERVYMGHVHCFGIQDYKGVRYVLTGDGGSPLFPCGSSDRFHHYLTVSVTSREIRERVHSADGSSFVVPSGKVLLTTH